MGFAISLLKITFKWAGSVNVISYTYIPNTESGFIYLFGGLGLIMFIIAIIRILMDVFNPIEQKATEAWGGGFPR